MIKSKLLKKFKHLFHGFSTIKEGSFSDTRSFSPKSAPIKDKLILAQQIHQNRIAIVDSLPTKSVIKNVDGLVTNQNWLCLGIKTADCVPILLFDPRERILGALHAGWRGTLSHIAKEGIDSMLKLGAKKDKIIAIIGPHIGSCCYNINYPRKKLFDGEDGINELTLTKFANNWHLDLGRLNYNQLVSEGILPFNIETMLHCTSCQEDLFYSYRRQGSSAGRMINFLCLQN